MLDMSCVCMRIVLNRCLAPSRRNGPCSPLLACSTIMEPLLTEPCYWISSRSFSDQHRAVFLFLAGGAQMCQWMWASRDIRNEPVGGRGLSLCPPHGSHFRGKGGGSRPRSSADVSLRLAGCCGVCPRGGKGGLKGS